MLVRTVTEIGKKTRGERRCDGMDDKFGIFQQQLTETTVELPGSTDLSVTVFGAPARTVLQ